MTPGSVHPFRPGTDRARCADCSLGADQHDVTTHTLTHAVTVHQPLAWAVAAGHCPIINSTTRPGLEHIGKLVGIHASQRHPSWLAFPDSLRPEAPVVRGALIGVARPVGVVRVTLDLRERRVGQSVFVGMIGKSIPQALPDELQTRIRPWWRGPWGWLLEEAALIPEPIPLPGSGGLWRVKDYADLASTHTHGAHSTVAAWALEQWWKARGA